VSAAEKINLIHSELANSSSLAGKYLTFRIADEHYGFEILKVQEIIGAVKVTRVPKMPSFVRGILNLRGKLIPVVDLRVKFGLDFKEDTEKTCIVVVQFSQDQNKITVGMIVDNVSEVLNISENQIEAAPEIGASVDTSFILSIGKVAEKVIILLDIDQVLTINETHQLISSVVK
jgi:purine-binding chemotaxis protein CheW